MDTGLASAVRRNTILLAVLMALSWCVVQLVATLGNVTLAQLTGAAALAGLAPAAYLVGAAAAGLAMGRFMDARGRRPGLSAGVAIGALSCLVVFAATSLGSPLGFVIGLAGVGFGAGTANLARAAAADMYPAERRARGISLVLLGAAVGAIVSPLLFAPLLAGVRMDPAGLAGPWIVAALVLVVGAALPMAMRVEPIAIARRLGERPVTEDAWLTNGRSLRVMIRLPGVPAALSVAVVAQGVMTGLMTVVGLAMVEHGHDLAAVSISLSAHFLGMFGLVLMAGQLVDRIGRWTSMTAGLAILAIGDLGLVLDVQLVSVVPAMFLIGLGWNIAFVASTATLADAAGPAERARLLGFGDFASIGASAAVSVVTAGIFGTLGLVATAALAAAVTVVPVVALLARRPSRAVATAS